MENKKTTNDKEKREALAEFRGQNSDPSIYEKAFDGSYIVHGHTKKYFWVLDEQERKELFKTRIEELQEMILLDQYDELPDELINSVLSQGALYPLAEEGKDEHIDGFYILPSGVQWDWDWQEEQEEYREDPISYKVRQQ